MSWLAIYVSFEVVLILVLVVKAVYRYRGAPPRADTQVCPYKIYGSVKMNRY
jgi:hypothetical protein